jgi:hypothetical protein
VGVWVRVGVGCGVNVVEGRGVGVAVGRVGPCPQAGREIIIKITTMTIKNRFMLILPRKKHRLNHLQQIEPANPHVLKKLLINKLYTISMGRGDLFLRTMFAKINHHQGSTPKKGS